MKQTIKKHLQCYCRPVAFVKVIAQGDVLVTSGDIEETQEPSWAYGDTIDEW